jgi:hypothetical protein
MKMITSTKKGKTKTHMVSLLTMKLILVNNKDAEFLGAKSTSIRDCVGRSVRWLVGPHDTITWKTSYAIASRRGGGRGKLVTSRFLRT